MLIDDAQIRKLGMEPFLGKVSGVSTPGEWGHYEFGGERLRSFEIERIYRDPTCSFCLEPLAGVTQRQHISGKGAPASATEWRQIDYDSITRHRAAMEVWMEDYQGEPRPMDPEVKLLVDSWQPKDLPSAEVLKEALDFAERCKKAMSAEKGVWQKPWPLLPPIE